MRSIPCRARKALPRPARLAARDAADARARTDAATPLHRAGVGASVCAFASAQASARASPAAHSHWPCSAQGRSWRAQPRRRATESRRSRRTTTPTATRIRHDRSRLLLRRPRPRPHVLRRRSRCRPAARELPGAGHERLDRRGALRPQRHHAVAHGECDEGRHLRRSALGPRTRLPDVDDRRRRGRARHDRARRRRRRHAVAQAGGRDRLPRCPAALRPRRPDVANYADPRIRRSRTSCSTRATGTPPTSGTRPGSAPSRRSATTPRSPRSWSTATGRTRRKATSPRSTDPIGRAGAARSSPRSADIERRSSAAPRPAGAGTARRGRSQPRSPLVGQMLPQSDNTLAEMLARIVSKESGFNGFAALKQAIPRRSPRYGVDTTVVTVVDGSGLSEFNGAPSTSRGAVHDQVGTPRGQPRLIWTAFRSPASRARWRSRFSGDAAVAAGRCDGQDRVDRHRLHALGHDRGRRHPPDVRVLRGRRRHPDNAKSALDC